MPRCRREGNVCRQRRDRDIQRHAWPPAEPVRPGRKRIAVRGGRNTTMNTSTKLVRAAWLWAGICGAHSTPGLASDFPAKPVRIVTADPGGTADVVARLVAQGLSGPLGQPVVVQNQG